MKFPDMYFSHRSASRLMMIRVGYELVMCEESLQQQTHLWLRLLQYWEINGCGAVCGILYSTVLVGTISSILLSTSPQYACKGRGSALSGEETKVQDSYCTTVL